MTLAMMIAALHRANMVMSGVWATCCLLQATELRRSLKCNFIHWPGVSSEAMFWKVILFIISGRASGANSFIVNNYTYTSTFEIQCIIFPKSMPCTTCLHIPKLQDEIVRSTAKIHWGTISAKIHWPHCNKQKPLGVCSGRTPFAARAGNDSETMH